MLLAKSISQNNGDSLGPPLISWKKITSKAKYNSNATQFTLDSLSIFQSIVLQPLSYNMLIFTFNVNQFRKLLETVS